MNNHSDRLSLPSGLQSAGDPVQGNPFSVDNPRHSVWSRATGEAEQESGRLRLNLAKARFENLPALVEGMINFATAQYDIWGKRGVHVVWNDQDVRSYDQWLHQNAESWLRVAADWCPDTVRAESLLGELQLHLIERLEWWKLEARRFVAEQQAHWAGVTDSDNIRDEERLALTSQVATESPGVKSASTTVGGSMQGSGKAPINAMEAAMMQEGWNAPRLAAKVRAVLKSRGITKLKVDRTTIYRLVTGKTKRPDPRIRSVVEAILKLPAERRS
jgi:hypothetical protein